MIRDSVPFSDIWRTLRGNTLATQAIVRLVQFIEKRTSGEMTYNLTRFPYMRPELADLLTIAEALRKAGVLKYYGPRYSSADEPQMYEWRTLFRDGEESASGGASITSGRDALAAALAEAIERYAWFETTDYFIDERRARVEEILQYGDALRPESFASFSQEQRASVPHLALRDVPYLWIRGERLPDRSPVYIPAQVISGSDRVRHNRHREGEPVIKYPITTGMAVWPTREGAIARGMLEAFERDAFMVTWLNRLSPNRIDVDRLCAQSPSLARFVEKCRRYRLEPHFVRLVTDAPTYVICTVLEDTTGHAPRFGFGIKAHQNPAEAAEGAIFEALRGRRGGRTYLAQKKDDDAPIDGKDVGHYKRILYWAEGTNHERLSFMIAGPVTVHKEPWEKDTDTEHTNRLLAWMKEREYDCATVSFTHSKANLSPWHIEMVVIPQLHPMHFNEREPYLGGKRLTDVPRIMGFEPRRPAYLDDPHPFA